MSIAENITLFLRHKGKIIIIWIISFILAAFFLISSLGWFVATYGMLTGKLGSKATEFGQSLSILDHIARTSQVVVIIVASVSLLLLRRMALKLYLANLIASVVCFLFIGKWGITFLTPLPLIVAYAYTYWINRIGFLR